MYNTYVLDSDYVTWALLLHCAEQTGSNRYLSSFILSRKPDMAANVQAYLRDKLTRYAIDLEFMFPMSQEDCDSLVDVDGPPGAAPQSPPQGHHQPHRVHHKKNRKHPLQRNHAGRRRG